MFPSFAFDGGLFSYEEHMVKPNKEFYEKLINKYNLNKAETIFFDDKEKNVIYVRVFDYFIVCFNLPNVLLAGYRSK